MEKRTASSELLKSEFAGLYGPSQSEIRIFQAPARINIIGEHIDYNGGKVFPAAIDKYLYCAVRKRDDSKIFYKDLFFPESFEFDINDDFKYEKSNGYANYLNGIIFSIKKRGFDFPCGFDLLIASSIPAGGGISSSAALESCFAYALSELFGFKISRKEIALIGQESEHNFMGVQCGIMDQYIISTGKEGTAELLDCAKVEHEYVPLNLGEYNFIVINSNKKHNLSDSQYNVRRLECEEALSDIQKAGFDFPALCAMSQEDFDKAKEFIKRPECYKRARHCVSEMGRVQQAVSALKKNDLKSLGRLISESHASLKNDYESSCRELDILAESAQKTDGCLGARIIGGGWGGCALALVQKNGSEKFIQSVGAEYEKAVGYKASFFTCSSGDGVKEV